MINCKAKKSKKKKRSKKHNKINRCQNKKKLFFISFEDFFNKLVHSHGDDFTNKPQQQQHLTSSTIVHNSKNPQVPLLPSQTFPESRKTSLRYPTNISWCVKENGN